MRKFIAGVVSAALIAGLGATASAPAQAAPLTVTAPGAVTPDTTMTEVRYKARHIARHRVVRHHRRYGGNPAAAAAFGLFGAALAGAIASSRYDDDYYYGPGYYPAYRYGYAAPRAYYGPSVGGPRFAGGMHRGGAWRGRAVGGMRGGFHGGHRH